MWWLHSGGCVVVVAVLVRYSLGKGGSCNSFRSVIVKVVQVMVVMVM